MTDTIWVAWETRDTSIITKFTNAHAVRDRQRAVCSAKIPDQITDEVQGLAKCEKCLNQLKRSGDAPKVKRQVTEAEVADAVKKFQAKGGVIRQLPGELHSTPGPGHSPVRGYGQVHDA